jgi:hypothetical protein
MAARPCHHDHMSASHSRDQGPLLTTPRLTGRRLRRVEYEFERLTIPRDLSRNVVTRLLVERAEHGGWEIHRLRVLHDGTRKVELRRKIIRQPRAQVVLS